MGRVIHLQHTEEGHPGGDRLMAIMGKTLKFPNDKQALKLAKLIKRQCEVCQVTEPSMGPYKADIVPTPVPQYTMSSVALDLFAFPEEKWEEKPLIP